MNIPAEFDETVYQQILADILSQSDRLVAVQMVKEVFQKKLAKEIADEYSYRLSHEDSVALLLLPESLARGFDPIPHEYVLGEADRCKVCERPQSDEMHAKVTDVEEKVETIDQ